MAGLDPRLSGLAELPLERQLGGVADRRRFGMIETALMAFQTRLDLAQARGAFKLAVRQGDKLAFAAQPAHPPVSSVRLDQFVEHIPRYVLQKPVKTLL